MDNERETELEALIVPVLEKAGVELDHMEFVRQGKDLFFRVYINKENGVDLNDCSYVSEKLSEVLDEQDPITEAYFLEVSSPGAEKALKTREDFMNHIGSNVYVGLYVHIGDEKAYEGILKEFANDIAVIEYKWKHTKKEIEIPFDKIAKARLSVML